MEAVLLSRIVELHSLTGRIPRCRRMLSTRVIWAEQDVDGVNNGTLEAQVRSRPVTWLRQKDIWRSCRCTLDFPRICPGRLLGRGSQLLPTAMKRLTIAAPADGPRESERERVIPERPSLLARLARRGVVRSEAGYNRSTWCRYPLSQGGCRRSDGALAH